MNTNDIINKLNNMKDNFPDLIVKKINLGFFRNVYIVTSEAVSSGDKVNDFILKYFSKNKGIDNLKKSISTFVPSINLKEVKTEEELFNFLFSGFTLIIYKDTFLAYETRAELDRGVTEPTNEPNIKGPKDSFTENYNKNVGLIRKRIKSTSLYLKEMNIGRQTQNKVGIMYMDNIAEKETVRELEKKLNQIDIDGVLDTNYFKELMKKENKSLFSTMICTEKPDDVCRYLLDGRIILMTENSPSILVIPTFFIDFFHSPEDYYKKSFFSTLLRLIRILAFFLAIITPAFYIAVTTYNQEVLPTSLLINFATQKEMVPFPTVIEALLLMVTFEILYEGDARTPTTRGTSLSILGALVLGDAAVQAGLISPIMVIVIAIAAISGLLFISYDLQGTIRAWRYILLIFSTLLGITGFIAGLIFMIYNICSIESFGKPYSLPFAPFNKQGNKNGIVRSPLNKIKYRTSYLTKKNFVRNRSSE